MEEEGAESTKSAEEGQGNAGERRSVAREDVLPAFVRKGIHEYLAHHKQSPPQGHHRAPGIVLL